MIAFEACWGLLESQHVARTLASGGWACQRLRTAAELEGYPGFDRSFAKGIRAADGVRSLRPPRRGCTRACTLPRPQSAGHDRRPIRDDRASRRAAATAPPGGRAQ